jgi:hypothetical protein
MVLTTFTAMALSLRQAFKLYAGGNESATKRRREGSARMQILAHRINECILKILSIIYECR